MRKIATVYKNGRITIPVKMRKRLGLRPGSVVTFEVNENKEVIIKPAKATNDKPAT
jgi:AbrB family looped-hinge helix DNA binding protein